MMWTSRNFLFLCISLLSCISKILVTNVLKLRQYTLLSENQNTSKLVFWKRTLYKIVDTYFNGINSTWYDELWYIIKPRCKELLICKWYWVTIITPEIYLYFNKSLCSVFLWLYFLFIYSLQYCFYMYGFKLWRYCILHEKIYSDHGMVYTILYNI